VGELRLAERVRALHTTNRTAPTVRNCAPGECGCDECVATMELLRSLDAQPSEHRLHIARAEHDFSGYEFEYEPGFCWLWIRWALRLRIAGSGPEGLDATTDRWKRTRRSDRVPNRLVATGMGFTLSACREKAYRAMVEDYAASQPDSSDLGTTVRESGTELANRVQGQRRADRVP
jgi:hypothetical protein